MNNKEMCKRRSSIVTTGQFTEEMIDKEIKNIISFFNAVTRSHYKSTTGKTRKLIYDRFAEGFATNDFKAVIVKKAKEWQGTDMTQRLNPNTLFGTKFKEYLSQPEVDNESPMWAVELKRRAGVKLINRLVAEYERGK